MTDKLFNTSALSLKPLADRKSKLSVNDLALPENVGTEWLPVGADSERAICYLADQVRTAKETNRKTILFMGAHLIKLGLTRYITDLILNGYIDHVATNGACAIHDFELNTHGGTSEDVQTYIDAGQFGLWKETSNLNTVLDREYKDRWTSTGISHSDAIRAGASIGSWLYHEEGASPETSIFAACHKMNVPITVHILIGGDINHSHPNFNAAAWGVGSYNDFLVFAESLRGLHAGGVFLNVGSAVHGPEIFLKALSMVRNVSSCEKFTTGVFDFADIPSSWRDFEPSPSTPLYYFRPWKTLLLRTNKGGHSEYVGGNFKNTIPMFWREIVGAGGNDGDA